MKYTTYLFDFDYTLADSSRGIVICFRNVLERHGHTGISDEAIKRTIGKTLEDSFSILSGITAPETLAEYKKDLKSATKLFSVLLASKRPLITELADKLRLKYPLLPTISPCPTMRLEAIRSIIPISCRRYPKSV